jgi:nucleoid-associated protein YgaU
MTVNSLCIKASCLLAAALLVVAAPVAAQDYDVAGGRYLTLDEYKRLSADEAQEYCEKLAQEIDIQNDNAAAANEMMSDIDSEISSLKRMLADARSANDPLADEVRRLEQQLKKLGQLPRSYTVVKDDWLIKISGYPRIYSDGTRWKRIYRANREKIDDPNLIYPDQIFLIPRGAPESHTVVEGETLRRIAGYWEVYGSRAEWTRIYEANRDQIADPNVIQPGMVLRIPR